MTHKILVALIAVLTTFAMVNCSNDDDGTINTKNLKEFTPISFSRSETQTIERTYDFGWKLFKAVDNQESGNFMISPLSVIVNLSMLANGAEGETLTQILDALAISNGDVTTLNSYSKKLIEGITKVDNSTDLQLSNALFVKSGINMRDDFVNTLKQWYDSDVLQIGNGKSDQINQWISNKTKNKINNLVSSEEEAKASYAVVNALCFDAIWSSPFSESATIDGVFSGAKRFEKASFMCKTTNVELKQNEDFAMARLNFGNNAFCIYFILPHEGVQLDDVLPGIDDTLLSSLTSETLNLHLRVPKFEIVSQVDLIEPAKSCGIIDAFDSMHADFSNMMDKSTNISFMRQGCAFSIDEKGVKVVSATVSADGVIASLIEDNGDFFLDRPFIFLIRENSSQGCLFMGKVEDI